MNGLVTVRVSGTGAFDSNIYLVSNGDDAAVIDAGTGLSAKGILRSIRDQLEGREVKAIILTHEHFDHSGGGKALATALSVPILASSECCRILRDGDDIYSGAGLFGFELEAYEDVEEVGAEIKLGGLVLEVHPVPGHCKGQISLIERNERALFCGDLAFCDGGVGRWDLPGGDLGELKRSLSGALKWDVRSLHPGHGREELKDPKLELNWAYQSIKDL
ncbi:MAG: MBL fold metallo-hydrolase [Candidatus Thermoplasmatota archaeon]|nr:MBL fold metallo-hydrolase [Candidatus Thermoplasmatota archaeon]